MVCPGRGQEGEPARETALSSASSLHSSLMVLGLLQDGELAQGVYTGNRGPAGEGRREEGRGRGEGAKQKCELFAVRQKS